MSSIRKTTEHQDPYNLPNMAAAVEATATAAADVEATATAAAAVEATDTAAAAVEATVTAAAAVEATVTVVGEAASALASAAAAAAAAAAEAIGAGLTAYERGALILMTTSPTYRSMRRPAWAYRLPPFRKCISVPAITITAAT
jgi:hypothetical protein